LASKDSELEAEKVKNKVTADYRELLAQSQKEVKELCKERDAMELKI